MIKNTITTLIALILLTSCKESSIKIIGRYSLGSDEEGDSYILSYKIDKDAELVLVDAYVYAIGLDSNFMILKRYPKNNGSITRTQTYYYIVPIYKNFTYSPEKGIIGPMPLEEFNLKRKELGIQNIGFNKILKNK